MTFYINKNQVNNDIIKVEGEDFHHIKNVLRFKIGEIARFCDDEGKSYQAKLINYTKKDAEFSIIQECYENTELSVDITLLQGIPKQDKMELIIQKSTELRCKYYNSSCHGSFYCKA